MFHEPPDVDSVGLAAAQAVVRRGLLLTQGTPNVLVVPRSVGVIPEFDDRDQVPS